MGQKASCVRNIMENDGTYVDLEFNKERTVNSLSPLQTVDEDAKEIRRLTKVSKRFLVIYSIHVIQFYYKKLKLQELEERDSELKRQEEAKKQLILKLCNAQKQMENSEQRLRKMEGEHEKAIKAIQGFIEREQQMEDTNSRKERKILELETELRKLQDCYNPKMRRNGHDLVSLKDLGVRNMDDTENDFHKQVNIAIYLMSFVC